MNKNHCVCLIKYIAACSVICYHAHILSDGSSDFLTQLLKHKITTGGIAISIFFAFSGFFMCKSIQNAINFKQYFISRIIKLIPGLAIVITSSIFILGPIVTSLSLKEYYTTPQTWLYLLNILFIPIHNLPGVFENCRYTSTINGSLWTLPVELICYIFLYLLHKMKLLQKNYIFISIPILVIINVLLHYLNYPQLISMIYPMISFLAGVFCQIYIHQLEIFKKYQLFLIDFILIIFLIILGNHNGLIYFILLPEILIIYINITSLTPKVDILGDASYGIYLVAFPIQQLLISICGGNMNPYLNIFITIIISTPLGIIIYYASFKIQLLCNRFFNK